MLSIGLKSNLLQIMRAKSKRLASTMKEADQPSWQWLNSDAKESGLPSIGLAKDNMGGFADMATT